MTNSNSAQSAEIVTRTKECFPLADVARWRSCGSEIIRISFEPRGDEPMLVWVYPETPHVFVETLAVFESCIEIDSDHCVTLRFPCGAVFAGGDTDPAEHATCAEWWFDDDDSDGLARLVCGLMSAAAEYYRSEILSRTLAETLRSGFHTAAITRDATEVRATFQNGRITVRVALECIEESEGLAAVHMSPLEVFYLHSVSENCEVTTEPGAGQGTCVSHFFRYTTHRQREPVLRALSNFVVAVTEVASVAPLAAE